MCGEKCAPNQRISEQGNMSAAENQGIKQYIITSLDWKIKDIYTLSSVYD